MLTSDGRPGIKKVLSGVLAEPAAQWVVEAGGTDDNFSTILSVYRDDRLVTGAGMAGTRLPANGMLNARYGVTNGEPYSEVIRVHPSVDSVVITTHHGTQVAAVLSDPYPEFGLRFGAAFLPRGEAPVKIRAEREGKTVQVQAQSLARLDWSEIHIGATGALYRRD